MDNLMKKFFRSSIVTSTILVILGILLFFKSEATIITIAYIIGAILIALGAVAIITFIKNTNNVEKNQLDIVYGVVTIIMGVLVVSTPEAIASIIPIIIGIGIVISSATKLQYSFELKSCNNPQWKATMIVSIISTICGIILLFNPFKGAVVITQVVAIFIIVYGLLDIISTIIIKKNVNAIHKAIEEEVSEAEVVSESEAEIESKAEEKDNKESSTTTETSKKRKQKSE